MTKKVTKKRFRIYVMIIVTITLNLHYSKYVHADSSNNRDDGISESNFNEIHTMNYEAHIPSNAPVSNINSGNIAINTRIILSTILENGRIYYTLDGSEPTEQSTLYTGPFFITKDTTIHAVAITKEIISEVSIYHYTIAPKVADPMMNNLSGPVPTNTQIEITTGTQNATIYYTKDGSTPNESSTVYTGPIMITDKVTIKAIAIKTNMVNSNVITAEFEISATSDEIPKQSDKLKIDQSYFKVYGAPEQITFGDKPFYLNTIGGSGNGPIIFAVTSGDAVSISGNTVTINKAGNATITATKKEEGFYNAATATMDIVVNKVGVKIETLPTVENIVQFGASLSTAELNGGKAIVPGKFVWVNPELIMRKAGEYEVIFIPTDADNYMSVTTYQGESAKVKIEVAKQPKTLTFKTSSITIALDQTYQQEVIVDEGRNDVVTTYSSIRPNVASVNSEGEVIPKKVGRTYILVKTCNNLTASYAIDVKKPPTKISLSNKNLTLEVGKTVTLKPSVKEGYYATYTFSSSDRNVATVNENGKITTKQKGTTIITIMSHNGLVVTCEIRVE